MNLKIGGNSVGKIMYGGQEFGNRKLEPGTILYRSEEIEAGFKNIHLLSTTKKWENINGINIMIYDGNFSTLYESINISGDDFKNLDIDKEYNSSYFSLSVSRSIVDGEYRLNLSVPNTLNFIIKAI